MTAGVEEVHVGDESGLVIDRVNLVMGERGKSQSWGTVKYGVTQ